MSPKCKSSKLKSSKLKSSEFKSPKSSSCKEATPLKKQLMERPMAPGRPTSEEALRMVMAFYCIMEPDKRDQLVKLAESLAEKSQIVDGCTHFSLLERNPQSRNESPGGFEGKF